MKVMIINGNYQYQRMFIDAGWDITMNIEEADLVQFTGGADVSPFLYGEFVHPQAHCDPRRDLVEAGYYAWAVRIGAKMAGICRGGQFLNVMNGGSMYQHVDGHCRDHYLIDLPSTRSIKVTSTHHQMMRVGSKGVTIAIAHEATFHERMSGHAVVRDAIIDEPADTEAVFYGNTNSLCFQPHPEFDGADSTREYYFELLNRYLGL